MIYIYIWQEMVSIEEEYCEVYCSLFTYHCGYSSIDLSSNKRNLATHMNRSSGPYMHARTTHTHIV